MRSHEPRWRIPALTLMIVSVAGSACSGSKTPVPAATNAGRKAVYVALGNGETAGNGVKNRIRDAWPQLLYRNDFPRATVFANFGQTNVTVEAALASQLPPALALNPTVATVNLTEDTFLTRDVAAFESRFNTLIRRLHRNGKTAVIIGNIPPGDREPGILACSPNPPAGSKPCQFDFAFDPQDENARDASFNAAIARVATANGATLVDLHAAFLAARARGEEDAFWAGNDFSPNEKGHAFIARQFAPAVRAALKSRG